MYPWTSAVERGRCIGRARDVLSSAAWYQLKTKKNVNFFLMENQPKLGSNKTAVVPWRRRDGPKVTGTLLYVHVLWYDARGSLGISQAAYSGIGRKCIHLAPNSPQRHESRQISVILTENTTWRRTRSRRAILGHVQNACV